MCCRPGVILAVVCRVEVRCCPWIRVRWPINTHQLQLEASGVNQTPTRQISTRHSTATYRTTDPYMARHSDATSQGDRERRNTRKPSVRISGYDNTDERSLDAGCHGADRNDRTRNAACQLVGGTGGGRRSPGSSAAPAGLVVRRSSSFFRFRAYCRLARCRRGVGALSVCCLPVLAERGARSASLEDL